MLTVVCITMQPSTAQIGRQRLRTGRRRDSPTATPLIKASDVRPDARLNKSLLKKHILVKKIGISYLIPCANGKTSFFSSRLTLRTAFLKRNDRRKDEINRRKTVLSTIILNKRDVFLFNINIIHVFVAEYCISDKCDRSPRRIVMLFSQIRAPRPPCGHR